MARAEQPLPSNPWFIRSVQMLCMGIYAAYFVHLLADFPNGSPWNDFAKFTDEGWYGGAALHRAQTGQWYTPGGFNPAVGLPVWPLLLAGWFALTGGPGIGAARALAVLLFGGSLLMLYLLLRPHTGRVIATFAVLLVVGNPYCYSFDRLAILEPAVALLFLLALWTATVPADGGGKQYPRAVGVGALLTAAVLTKTTAAVLAPAMLYQLWATASGSVSSSQAKGRTRLRTTGSYLALRLVLVAAGTAVALWAVYSFALVRPYHLADYRQLFLINAGKAHGRILLQVMARALGDTLWIDRILLPLAMLAVAASARFMRELWRIPLFVSGVLSLAATVGFIGWHTWFQPRYYLLCVFPAMVVLALATKQLGALAQTPGRGAPWRVAHRLTLLLVGFSLAAMLRQTAAYMLHPQYSFRDAAEDIARILRADRVQPPVLLAGSGDTLGLFTGIRTVNPEWPVGGLAGLLRQQRPGWLAAYVPLEDRRVADFARVCSLQAVASYPVMDEPQHRLLVLYRLESCRPW